jgi:hypothetical protein
MGTSLDEVIETVRAAREDGPEALAAMALRYGATMALGAIGNRALRGRIAEMRAAARAADEDIATLQHERDATLAELKAEREDRAETRAEVWRLRESVAALRAERDESQAAHEHTRAQWATACRERDEARNALATAGKIAAEAVREREAFGLRASAAERERDEARAERDALRARPTYEARTVAPTEEERGAHEAAGGLWLVRTNGGSFHVLKLWRGTLAIGVMPETLLPLGADGLPCAWPVAGEVSL